MTVGKMDVNKTLERAKKMLAKNRGASEQAEAMAVMMETLLLLIQLLLEKIGINSSNSSTPPAQDPKRKRGSKKKVKGKKLQPGGQKGRQGKTLKKVDSPDTIEVLNIDRRTIPSGEYISQGFESRQVIDIQISRHVTEYRAEVLVDPQGKKFIASFPKHVTRPVQYGSCVKAQAVYMSQSQLIPYQRTCDYFIAQAAIPISPGSIFNFNKEAFTRLEHFETWVKNKLATQEVLHADETGININGKLQWLHTLGNKELTFFYPHPKRGGEAMQAMGVLERYQGILCHDHWKAYFQYSCQHALCNAHHLRELERVWECERYAWTQKMQALLLEMRTATEKKGGCLDKKTAELFKKRYRRIITEGKKACPLPAKNKPAGQRGRMAKSKGRNLLERLSDFEEETLRFMTNPLVPFTNNQGENDIRMTKVQQKISGCFRAIQGAEIFCRVRSYLSTCQKNGIKPAEALRILFSGAFPDFMRI